MIFTLYLKDKECGIKNMMSKIKSRHKGPDEEKMWVPWGTEIRPMHKKVWVRRKRKEDKVEKGGLEGLVG